MLMESSPDAQERGFRANGELFRSGDFTTLHQCHESNIANDDQEMAEVFVLMTNFLDA